MSKQSVKYFFRLDYCVEWMADKGRETKKNKTHIQSIKYNVKFIFEDKQGICFVSVFTVFLSIIKPNLAFAFSPTLTAINSESFIKIMGNTE